MNAPLVSLSRLLHDLDDLKIDAKPLQPHFVMRCDTHVRERYAGLLAAILLAQGKVDEAQSRLFCLLLGSLGLSGSQARLFEQAPSTDRTVLSECARFFGEQGLMLTFFVDAAILLRLAGPLSAESQQLLCELADFFGLSPTDLAFAADLAAIVLCMEPTQDIPPEFDYGRVSAWEEFLYRTLTAERLMSGPLRGMWKIAAPMTLTSGWTLEGARLRFEGEGRVLTEMTEEGKVQIADGYLENPLMRFAGKVSVEITNTKIYGEYPEGARCTAIAIIPEKRTYEAAGYTLRSDSVKLSGLEVCTRNARSFLIQEVSELSYHRYGMRFEVNDCHFSNCGNRYLNGGAIAICAHSGEGFNESNVTIKKSKFEKCQARFGGGVFVVDGLKFSGVVDSIFESCASFAYNSPGSVEDFAFGGGAIFAHSLHPGESSACIINCIFKNTSLQAGYSHEGSRNVDPVYGCEFDNSFLAYTGGSYAPGRSCTFSNKQRDFNGPIKIEKEEQSWWSEY